MCSAGTPNVSAIAGNAVVSTVESSCSMNSALAMINAVIRKFRGCADPAAPPARSFDMVSGLPHTALSKRAISAWPA